MTTTSPPTPSLTNITDPAQFTNALWAVLVLTYLKAPITSNNVNNLLSWMSAENSPSTWTGTAGANNPLNNGLGSGGGAGLGSYPDLNTAAAYAAKGMEGGISGSAPIGDALKADAPFSVFHAATINSNWAQYHYAGSDWASATSPYNVPTVTAAASEKGGATKGVAIGNAQLGDVGVSGVIDTAGQAAKAAVSYTEEIGKLVGDVLSVSFWTRVGMGVLGVGLIVFGSVLFFSSTKSGQRAISEGERAGEGAAVAAAA